MISMNPIPAPQSVIKGLNMLVQTLSSSLTIYVVNASPWVRRESSCDMGVLESVVADQRQLIDQLGTAILDRRGIVVQGAFPTEFTDLNDLSLDYLLKEAAKFQRRDLQTIEIALDKLDSDDDALALGQRVLGAAKAHLEMLNGCNSK